MFRKILAPMINIFDYAVPATMVLNFISDA